MSCGNCTHNCCCSCKLDHCRQCDQKYGQWRKTHCSWNGYPNHFICVKCETSAKVNESYDHRNKYENVEGYLKPKFCSSVISYNAKCPKCAQYMTPMGRNFRVPKKGSHEWKIINLLQNHSDNDLIALGKRDDVFAGVFYDSMKWEYSTLSDIWQQNLLKYDWSHKSYRSIQFGTNVIASKHQRRFSIPTRLGEYPHFLEHLRSIYVLRIFNATNMWKMIKMFVKIRSIVNYMKTQVFISETRKQKSKVLTHITLLPSIGSSYMKAKEYFEIHVAAAAKKY